MGGGGDAVEQKLLLGRGAMCLFTTNAASRIHFVQDNGSVVSPGPDC